MRSIALFILTLLFTQAYGQKRFDLDFTNKSLYEAVEHLSSKHKFKFSYNPTSLKTHQLDRKIRANSEAELISAIFSDLPFKIQISDGVYLVIPKKIDKTPRSLAGKIYDKETGKPLAFAHVQSEKKGTISNQEGRFRLPPREDTITIEVSYIGYKDLKLDVPPNTEDIALNLELNPQVLQEVILNTSQTGDLSGKPGFFSMNPEQFNALPTLGETDVFKSIQLLPGVQATDETASGLSVRGGTPAQNLIMMDGYTLYHLDHFFGIFSTLNPNVIDNVSLYKGGFGPEYGGRISSVVDVTGKSGSKEKFKAKAGFNFLTFNGMVEAPIGSNTSFLLGMRKSGTGILNTNLFNDFISSNRQSFLQSINPDIASLEFQPSLDFYDFNGKIQHRFNDNSMVDINLFLSEDVYGADFQESDDFAGFEVKDRASWENSGISARWKKNINNSWHSNLTIGASEFTDNQNLDIEQEFFQDAAFESDSISRNTVVELFQFGVSSTVSDLTIKSDHEIELANEDLIKAGIEFNAISTSYDSDESFLESLTSQIIVRDTLTLESTITSAYGSYQFEGTNIRSSIGVRGTYYDPTNDWYIEPRFDLNFKLSDKFNLKGAASLHHQFVNQTSLSFFDNDNKFYWVLADDASIPILKSTHLIFGGNYAHKRWTIDIEYYRKATDGIIENRLVERNPTTLQFIDQEDLNLAGENLSEGLDVFVKYRTNTFTSWMSYSLSESMNRFWYIDQNNPYPSNQDQRHEVNWINTLKIKNWELSSAYIYGSGRPYTIPILEDDFNVVFDDSEINTQRLPAYKRLDLSAKYSFSLGKSKCEAGLTLFNILDRINIKSRRFTQKFIFDEADDEVDEDEVILLALDTRLLGFTPNFFFNIRF